MIPLKKAYTTISGKNNYPVESQDIGYPSHSDGAMNMAQALVMFLLVQVHGVLPS